MYIAKGLWRILGFIDFVSAYIARRIVMELLITKLMELFEPIATFFWDSDTGLVETVIRMINTFFQNNEFAAKIVEMLKELF